MQDMIGKSALVTGGSRGIGAAIAKTLAARGADVAITYEKAADSAAAIVDAIEKNGRRGFAIQADSCDPEALQAAVHQAASELGRLDILVNNAGIFPYGAPEAFSLEEIDRTLAIHVRAVYVASQAALAHLPEGGRILSIGSCFAQRVPYEGLSLYAMSKTALIGFTKGLARDLGPRGITVNVIDPGSTDTDMNPADSLDAEGERAWIALGHYGQPEDIAAMAGHLAGEGGRYISGVSIAVDGGYAA